MRIRRLSIALSLHQPPSGRCSTLHPFEDNGGQCDVSYPGEATPSGSSEVSIHSCGWALHNFPPLTHNKAFCTSQFNLPSITETWILGIREVEREGCLCGTESFSSCSRQAVMCTALVGFPSLFARQKVRASTTEEEVQAR